MLGLWITNVVDDTCEVGLELWDGDMLGLALQYCIVCAYRQTGLLVTRYAPNQIVIS